MGKVIFVIIILVWMAVGTVGLLQMRKDRVKFEMIIFMGVTPFLPLIAWACGII